MRQLGAREFDLDINTGAGFLLPAEGRALVLEELVEAVESAGFELLETEFEVWGRLGHVRGPADDEIPALEVESTAQSFALLEGHSDGEREAWVRLSPHLERSGSTISVRGRAHSHVGGGTALFVNDFQLTDE